MEKPLNIDQFIENSAKEAQPILLELRKMLKAAFQDIEEKIGYGVPQYTYKNSKIGMSVAKNHVTIGFDYGIISEETRTQLEEKGYKLGLQTLQIKFTQDIPKEIINKIFSEIIAKNN